MARAVHTIQLDICGQICPSCLLLTLRTINQNREAILRGEAEALVLTNDRQAIGTIPDAAAKMGYATEVDRSEDRYRIRIFAL